jgi:hypothetical protein
MIKICSLAAVLMLCLSGSLWADSVNQGDVINAFNLTNNDIGQNAKVFESSKILQSEYIAAGVFDVEGLALWSKHRAAAEADFAAAINELKLVATGVTPSASMPDAGSIGLLSCSGLLLFGAMRRKFSR